MSLKFFRKLKAAAESSTLPMGLRGQLFTYLLLFVLVMLIMLWLLQVVYLDVVYKWIKVDQIKASGETLCAYLEKEDELQTVSTALAQDRQQCITVLRVKNPELFSVGLQEICSVDVLYDCIIHHMSIGDYRNFYDYAESNGGIYTKQFSRVTFNGNRYQTTLLYERSFWDRMTAANSNGLPDSLIYARIATLENGHTYLLLINSSITPMAATVGTLRVELLMVTLVLLILAVVLSNLLSRRLAKPLIGINRQARKLARGDFSVRFLGHGYPEAVELAETLNYASEELGKSERLQQELVANISHDLRTPLTMIGGYAEFMRDFPEEDHSESIAVIIDETARLSALVRDVLEQSRLSAGVEQLHAREYDLAEQLRQLTDRYNALLEKDHYRIALEAPASLLVYGDPTRIEQAAGNLLNNALTHCGADRQICIRLKTVDGEQGEQPTGQNGQSRQTGQKLAQVEICDNGPGIAADQLANIWQRYYRTDAHQRASHGSGLGLAIAREVFLLHGCAFGVESEVGEGSTFWFCLPLAPAER